MSYKRYNQLRQEDDMQSIQVADLKSHFSDILKTIKNDGERFIIEYGKQHEKIAMLIP
jgi:antitoxin (DNA-binding transcriptional repressor) of toxin-antitoxin stability system